MRLRCIVCENDLQTIKDAPPPKRDPFSLLLDKAVATEVDMGFGSIFDTDTFVIMICDKCIQNGLDRKTIIRI